MTKKKKSTDPVTDAERLALYEKAKGDVDFQTYDGGKHWNFIKSVAETAGYWYDQPLNLKATKYFRFLETRIDTYKQVQRNAQARAEQRAFSSGNRSANKSPWACR